ncbi:MAG: aminodeoxychorismate synthase component I [Blastomonas sp.]
MTPASAPLTLADSSTPFILLDDARTDRPVAARLYRDPVEICEAHDPEGLAALLERIEEAGRQGLHAAGYFAYEAGLALEPRLAPLLSQRAGTRLAWFALFRGYEEIAPDRVAGLLPAPADTGYALGPVVPALSRVRYDSAFAMISEAIRAGDIYQANLTFMSHADFAGDPLALYRDLRVAARSGYGGVLFDGSDWLLSLSPELFFTLHQGQATVRPMKGTAPRHRDAGDDRAAADALAASAKDRAENLMIVDLMRNDLSRIARPGSVRTDRLFAIEHYPTVHQMTSTIRAELAPGKGAAEMIRAIFPCGSITGAPKIRAMELIHAVEADARGVYCGAIGRFDPPQGDRPGDAAFNVAIRTLHLPHGSRKIAFGLGSGIVADSDGLAEWQECRIKGRFVEQLVRPFDLIETMAFDPASGIARLEAHLARMKASAAELGFEFDRHAARNALNAACFTLEAPRKVRLLLARSGAIALEMSPMPDSAPGPLDVALAPLPVDAGDFRLRHKTTDRGFYDEARCASGKAELVFIDRRGRLTEGSFTHVYVERDGKLLTPPLALGLLPGILRAELIETGRAVEAELSRDDLGPGFFIGNSLRGLMPARLAE